MPVRALFGPVEPAFSARYLSACEVPEHTVLLPFAGAEVKCRERLGGLLKHYFCDAA